MTIVMQAFLMELAISIVAGLFVLLLAHLITKRWPLSIIVGGVVMVVGIIIAFMVSMW